MLKILEVTILNSVSNILNLIQYISLFTHLFLIIRFLSINFIKHLKIILKIFYFLFQNLDYLLIASYLKLVLDVLSFFILFFIVFDIFYCT